MTDEQHECDRSPLRVLGLGSVDALAVSPDGRLLASAGERGAVVLWCLERRRIVRLLEDETSKIRALCFGPQGHHLASLSSRGGLSVWDASAGVLLWRASCRLTLALAFDPTGARLLVAGRLGTIQAFALDGGGVVAERKLTMVRVERLWFDEGRRLRVGGTRGGRAVVVWLAGGQPPGAAGGGDASPAPELDGDEEVVATGGEFGFYRAAALSPDVFVTGPRVGGPQLWSATSGEALATLPLPAVERAGEVSGLAISPDGSTLVAGYSDRATFRWSLASRRALPPLEGGSRQRLPTQVAYAGGGVIVTAPMEGPIRLWSADEGRLLDALEGHGAFVAAGALSPDGRACAAAGCGDDAVRVFAVDADAPPALFGRFDGVITSALYDPRGRALVVAATGGVIESLDARDGRSLGEQRVALGGYASRLAVHPDGRRIAAGLSDGSVYLFDLRDDGAVEARPDALGRHGGWVKALAFDPTGRLLASGAVDGTLCVWDVEEGHAIATWRNEGRQITAVAFDPSGATLAWATWDGPVCRWDTQARAPGEELARAQPLCAFTALAFDPRGAALVLGDLDGRLSVRDPATGATRATFLAHGSSVEWLSFSADGGRLASTSNDGTVRVWPRHVLGGEGPRGG